MFLLTIEVPEGWLWYISHCWLFDLLFQSVSGGIRYITLLVVTLYIPRSVSQGEVTNPTKVTPSLKQRNREEGLLQWTELFSDLVNETSCANTQYLRYLILCFPVLHVVSE